MSSTKIAVISDVHANYQALAAVLYHAEREGVEETWFLGDAVGYGPDPHRCIRLLKESVANLDAWVLGNHDEVLQYSPDSSQPEDVGNSISRHLRTHLSPIAQCIGIRDDTLTAYRINYDILDGFPDRRDFLLKRKVTSQIGGKFFLVHGGVHAGKPTVTYVYDRIDVHREFWCAVYKVTKQALNNLKNELPRDIYIKLIGMKNGEYIGEETFLDSLKQNIGENQVKEYGTTILEYAFLKDKKRFEDPCLNIFFLGHTHQPTCFKSSNNSGKTRFSRQDLGPGKYIQLDDEHAWYLNPGSVGQPRDGDSRASYMVLDMSDHTVQLHRVEYNIRATQKQMEALSMPVNLITRLYAGG